MSLRALVMAACLALTVPPAPPVWTVSASSSAEWGATTTLGGPTTDASSVDLAVGPTGLAAATWSRGRRVMVALRPPGAPWGRPVRLGTRLGAEPLEPSRVAVDARGRVTVVWVGGRTFWGDRLFARTRSAGGEWGRPVQVSRTLPSQPYDELWQPEVLVNARGDTLVVWGWTRDDSFRRTRTVAALRPVDGRWSRPVELTDVDPVAATLDRRGGVMLYVAAGRYRDGLSVVRRSPTRGWLTMRPLMDASIVRVGTLVALGDPAGDQLLMFSRRQAGERRVMARWKRAGHPWSPLETLAAASDFAVALDGTGHATALLVPTPDAGPVRTMRGTPGEHWSVARRLSRRDQRVSDVAIAAGPTGDLVAAWTSVNVRGGSPDVWACTAGPAGRWAGAVRLTPADTHRVGPFTVAIGGPRAAAAWTSSRGDEPADRGRLRVRVRE